MMDNLNDLQARAAVLREEKRTATDNMDAFLIAEELLDVNARIRALRPKSRTSHRQALSAFAPDRQQFVDWDRAQHSFDEEIDEGRQLVISAAVQARGGLTKKQRAYFDAFSAGESISEIAARYGVNRSTVSRLVSHAKAKLKAGTVAQVAFTKCSDDERHIDLSQESAATALLGLLTDKQAVCLYLFYGARLRSSEIANLLGVERSTVSRTLQRGLLRIQKNTGAETLYFDNFDKLDGLIFEIYCQIEPPGETATHHRRPRTGARSAPTVLPSVSTCPAYIFTGSDGVRETAENGFRHADGRQTSGKLLTALWVRVGENAKRFSVWIEHIFCKLRKKARR